LIRSYYESNRSFLFGHPVVKFVKEEAKLVTDPVFSPDAMKADRKREIEKEVGRN
jgi:hypothetical protein